LEAEEEALIPRRRKLVLLQLECQSIRKPRQVPLEWLVVVIRMRQIARVITREMERDL